MTTKLVGFLTVAFVVIFAVLIFSGIAMLFRADAQSVPENPPSDGAENEAESEAQPGVEGQNDTEVELDARSDGVSVRIRSRLPGIIMIVVGVAGLCLMILRLPLPQVVARTPEKVRATAGSLGGRSVAKAPMPVVGVLCFIEWLRRRK